MSESFWICTRKGCKNPTHHYKPERCQTCGAPVKEHVVDDTASLRKLLDIPEPKVSKK